MMKKRSYTVLLAPDSFKGSLTSEEVSAALERGIRSVNSDVTVKSVTLSDGGEGFIDVFRRHSDGILHSCEVLDPLGAPMTAQYFEITATNTIVIEMAQASGLTLIPEEKRNPFQATTYGTGQLIADALDKGFRQFIIGIGGSATSDGGAGMAQALGVRFYDDSDNEICEPMNSSLIGKCRRISIKNIHKAISESQFRVACDVKNPLLGPEGAVYTYSPQKGASQNELPVLERNMSSFYSIVEFSFLKKVRDLPGAGAAGGLGAGLVVFLNATLESGIDLILDGIRFDNLLSDVDLVITGEGRIDNQTMEGKALMGVIRRAAKLSIPVIAVAGKVDCEIDQLINKGVTSVYSLIEESGSESEAIEKAAEILEVLGRRIMISES
ncbi:MAG: glycerate kinase [Candidatus Marinimicrobia bacterium]|nr:glycerate kinase [Candidatus Neomarinimicrobiota bacterium]